MVPAPSLNRPTFRMLNATTCPRPISPSTFSTGTLASSRITAHVEEPLSPIFRSSGPTLRPGESRSTMNAVNFSPSTFAKMMKTSAEPALVMYCLVPLSR